MKRIAIEEHLQIPELDRLTAEIEKRLNFPSLSDPNRMQNTLMPVFYAPPEEHRFPLMDRYGIDMHVLSVTMGIQLDLDTERAIRNSRMANDTMYELTQKYPDRFRAFAALPMQDPAAAADELERCITELGFVGTLLGGSSNYHYYDEPQFEPVWAVLEKYGLPMYIHVQSPEADQIRMYEGYDELLGNTWNWGEVAATHALRIIFSGLFDRHPGCSLILGHMGESLPFLLGRLDEGYDCRNVKAKGRMAHHPSYYLKKNFYVTTSGGWRPEAIHCTIEALGAEHVLFANDYPHYPLESTMKQMEESGLTPEQQELIYHKNAERLLKLNG